VSSLWREAAQGLRARRRRAALSALGVALAATMLSTSAVVAYGLATGFDRSANAAGLGDVIADFQAQPLSRIALRVRALPDIAAVSYRLKLTSAEIATRRHFARNGVVDVLGSGRRGYAVLSGHDLTGHAGEVLVEQGLAGSWGLRPGSMLSVGGVGALRVVGITDTPDDVAYPLAAPRVYVSRATYDARFSVRGTAALPPLCTSPALLETRLRHRPRLLREIRRACAAIRLRLQRNRLGLRARPPMVVNEVELWARNRSGLDALLVQARESAYGIEGLTFVTRDGVRVLVDQAAGIVIALLVALSVVALLTAAVMLGASARADVQRRLVAVGVRRAVGATRTRVAALSASEAAITAAPAATLGILAGLLAASGPSSRLLDLLNERPPGAALALPLAGCWIVAVTIPVALSAWPAWRAATRAPSALLGGGELRAGTRSQGGSAGLLGLGGRLVLARRARLLATLAMLGTSAAFILLMLALASELSALENNPSALGQRYQLLAALPASDASAVAALPGVAAAAPRYELNAADSFSLGETIDVIAYRNDPTTFEDPPLGAGHRLNGSDQAVVGVGLAEALGLSPGATLALALPSGNEVRLRVAGTVNALEHDGRVAYVPAAALLAADPDAPEQIAVRLDQGANVTAVSRELAGLGAAASPTETVTGKGQTLVDSLTAILRAVAIVDGLVCLYTLMQALALVAVERRETIAVLRACGAGRSAVLQLLAGAAFVVVAPAAIVGVALERLLLGPSMTRIAAGYATLPLGASEQIIAAVALGLLTLAAIAVIWVSRQAVREPIVTGLPT
jgi:ABC-type lipoprotein release transport system permease subunit